MTSETFTEVPFWSAFRADLKKAEGHVIIQSPFVSNRRLKYLANDLLELNRRGVTVCVCTECPSNAKTPTEKNEHTIDRRARGTRISTQTSSKSKHRTDLDLAISLLNDRIANSALIR